MNLPTSSRNASRLPLIGIVVLVAATIFSGVLHGTMNRRWGSSSQLAEAAKRIESVPMSFGDWELKEPEELPPLAKATLESAGSRMGKYVNRRTGDAVTAALVVGPAGPMSVHLAEICYSGANFKVREDRKPLAIEEAGGPTHQFWSLQLESKSGEGGFLHVCYGWSDGNAWTAPSEARFAFVGRPYLYKIQVAASVLPGINSSTDPCVDFLTQFVPVVRRCLATATEK